MSASSSRVSFRMSSPRALAKGLGLHHAASKEQTIGGVVVSSEVNDAKIMEGHLFVRIHVRRRRYCVLRGRALLVFDSKDDELASAAKGSSTAGAKKVITVVGVRNATELDKAVRASLLGLGGHASSLDNALVISTQKSKLVVVEAETPTEKQRWLHAMSCLNFASSTSEKSVFAAMLQDSASFDAHVAVSLLHQYRDNAVATELVIDRLAEYADRNIDDVEFYIQQIMHLVVNAELATPEKLVHLLLSICKAKAYVEHLGNCIHLALQLFWLLEAKIEDKDPRTYNLCAKLLMSIEAKVVNQHFELPERDSTSSSSGSIGGTSSNGAVSTLLMEIPGMRERLRVMSLDATGNQASACSTAAKAAAATRPEEPSSTLTTKRSLTIDTSDATLSLDDAPTCTESVTCESAAALEPPTVVLSPDDAKLQRELALKWMEKERLKRYKYFHEQRDFVKALADISEKMRLVDPPHERKQHLPVALEALVIPDMAYIPLGRVSDRFCRITRVLKDEGTVFSTHSRAPCLLCFEVIEDHVNAAGHRSSISKTPSSVSSSTAATASPRWSRRSARSSDASEIDEETEIVGLIKKFSINGKLICVDEHAPSGGGDTSDAIGDGNATEPRDASATHTEALAALQELERQLDIATVRAVGESDCSSGSALPLPPPVLLTREEMLCSAASSSLAVSSNGSMHDETSLIRRHSQSAYEGGLAKMMIDGGVFGESWTDKKERIRVSSPYGHLPGWNIISLISKSNDDIRQEVFAMQLITKFQDIFRANDLPLFLRPYRIVSTGKTCGLLETITDAQSLDALKKQRDYRGLRDHLERTHGGAASRAFKVAQRNFLHSLVAYSLVCYLLQIKDRHNGNILLDTDGRLVHIDFGFLLGIAPGGSWSFETAPFKLTKEMVDVLGGVSSSLFGDFVMLFVRGLLAAQRSAEQIITLVEIMMRHSSFPCFQDRDVGRDLQRLRARFLLPLSTEQLVKASMKMISASYKNAWTKRYDQFQKLTNGILP